MSNKHPIGSVATPISTGYCPACACAIEKLTEAGTLAVASSARVQCTNPDCHWYQGWPAYEMRSKPQPVKSITVYWASGSPGVFVPSSMSSDAEKAAWLDAVKLVFQTQGLRFQENR